MPRFTLSGAQNIGFAGNSSLAVKPNTVLQGQALNVMSGSDGSRQIVQSTDGSAEVRAAVVPAVPQTDLLQLNGLANGANWTTDIGKSFQWMDLSAAALTRGKIIFIDPNGVPHDLAMFTKTKSTGDGFVPPTLPPGRYVFINISGAAIGATDFYIYVQHIGARNLA